MLKYVVSLLCALFVFGGIFADDAESLLAPEPDYTKTETVQGKITSDYLKKGGGQVNIEYMPAYDEARFKYSCPEPLFEQSTAMLAIKESIEAFVKENNPKYANRIIRQLKAYAKAMNFDKNYDPYKAAYGSMPAHASANPEIRHLYINGHFCYVFKFGIVSSAICSRCI